MASPSIKRQLQVIFVIPHDIGGWGHHGIAVLSACLKQKGFCNTSAFAMDSPRILPTIRKSPHVVVAFSTLTPYARKYLALAEAIKRKTPAAVTVFGGPHVTAYPEIAANDSVDGACVGEAEEALADFLEAYDYEKMVPPTDIANWWVKGGSSGIIRNKPRPLVMDLDVFPFADREVLGRGRFPKNRVQWFTFSRGYPGTGHYRLRSPEHAIKEIRHVLGCYGGSVVRFQDPIFGADPAWLDKFCHLYKQDIGLPFGCTSEVALIDEQYVSLLGKAGCVFVKLELGATDTLLHQKGRLNPFSNEACEAAVQVLRRNRIKTGFSVTLGMPKASLEDDLRTFSFVSSFRPDNMHSQIFSHYPQAGLYGREAELNYRFEDLRFYDDVYWPVVDVVNSGRDIPSLKRLHVIFNFCVYFRVPLDVVRVLLKFPVECVKSFFYLLQETMPFFWLYYGYILKGFFDVKAVHGRLKTGQNVTRSTNKGSL